MSAVVAAGRPLTPVQQYDLLCRSPAFQAGLRAPKPAMTAPMARVVVPLIRPGLAALEELGEAGDPAA